MRNIVTTGTDGQIITTIDLNRIPPIAKAQNLARRYFEIWVVAEVIVTQQTHSHSDISNSTQTQLEARILTLKKNELALNQKPLELRNTEKALESVSTIPRPNKDDDEFLKKSKDRNQNQGQEQMQAQAGQNQNPGQQQNAAVSTRSLNGFAPVGDKTNGTNANKCGSGSSYKYDIKQGLRHLQPPEVTKVWLERFSWQERLGCAIYSPPNMQA